MRDHDAMFLEGAMTSAVTGAAWLVKQGDLELALRWRDAFLVRWGFSEDLWDLMAGPLAAYAEDAHGNSEDARALRAIVFGVVRPELN